ncbi:MAG: hypothetical protein WC758_08395, partial [Candidatus Woesearchaeota archaeon]
LHFMKKREFGWHILTYNLELLNKQAKAYLHLLLRAISIPDRALKSKYLNTRFFEHFILSNKKSS